MVECIALFLGNNLFVKIVLHLRNKTQNCEIEAKMRTMVNLVEMLPCIPDYNQKAFFMLLLLTL